MKDIDYINKRVIAAPRGNGHPSLGGIIKRLGGVTGILWMEVETVDGQPKKPGDYPKEVVVSVQDITVTN